MPLNQQPKKGAVPTEAIDPDCKGKTELLLNTGGKGEYVWNTGDPQGLS